MRCAGALSGDLNAGQVIHGVRIENRLRSLRRCRCRWRPGCSPSAFLDAPSEIILATDFFHVDTVLRRLYVLCFIEHGAHLLGAARLALLPPGGCTRVGL